MKEERVKYVSLVFHTDQPDLKAAIAKMRQTADEFEKGLGCMSEHPADEEPYLPYTYASVRETIEEVSDTWWEKNPDWKNSTEVSKIFHKYEKEK